MAKLAYFKSTFILKYLGSRPFLLRVWKGKNGPKTRALVDRRNQFFSKIGVPKIRELSSQFVWLESSSKCTRLLPTTLPQITIIGLATHHLKRLPHVVPSFLFSLLNIVIVVVVWGNTSRWGTINDLLIFSWHWDLISCGHWPWERPSSTSAVESDNNQLSFKGRHTLEFPSTNQPSSLRKSYFRNSPRK